MTKLRTTIASAVLAATAFGVAVPAQAQYDHRYDQHDRNDRDDRRGGDRYDNQYRGQAQALNAQINDLERRVQRLDGRDRISEREAAGLRRDVYRLRQQFRSYSRDGLSRREVQVLQDRVQQVRYQLRVERKDRDGRRW